MTTYTVYRHASDFVEGSGLTAEQAAEIILSHDGARWELRREPARWDIAGVPCWQVYGPPPGGRGEWVPYYDGPPPHGRALEACAPTEAEAWAKIAPMVLTADWRGPFTVMTDADFDAMMAELAAERED